MSIEDWDISNLPPEGHEDVKEYFWSLFEMAKDEKERLRIPDKMRANYKLYRGDHWGAKKKKSSLSLNLFFANVQRTVANITARNPVAEAVNLDGEDSSLEKLATASLKKWWQDSDQKTKLRVTSQRNEKYGFTVEKPYWDKTSEQPNITVLDGFAFFPAPGYYEDFGLDAPYACHAYAEPVSGVERMHNVEGVEASDVYSILGEDREGSKPVPLGADNGSVSHASNPVQQKISTTTSTKFLDERALVVEIWIRDVSTKPLLDNEGQPQVDDEGQQLVEDIYPGGIRCVRLTNEGDLLLSDEKNPNINWEMEPSLVKGCFLYNRLPFSWGNSYTDSTCNYGFSAAEQTWDLSVKIDELFSRLVSHIQRSMTGILIIPPKSGITKRMLSNNPGLVLFPQTAEAAAGIRYVGIPSLPSDFFTAFNMLIEMYDRIYAIQDADRGNAPNGITAASAIIALQERNAVLVQHKINTVDKLIEFRGQSAISLWQCHGHKEQNIEIDDGEKATFIGRDLAGKKFNYVVEAGSTMPKTSLQISEQAKDLYSIGLVDQRAALEAINFPGWKKIVERMAEDKLGGALEMLVQAGLPEDQAQYLQQVLSQPQGGPGDTNQTTQTVPQPGVPRAMQGEINNATV